MRSHRGVAAAALAGCGGGVRQRTSDDRRQVRPPPPRPRRPPPSRRPRRRRCCSLQLELPLIGLSSAPTVSYATSAARHRPARPGHPGRRRPSTCAAPTAPASPSTPGPTAPSRSAPSSQPGTNSLQFTAARLGLDSASAQLAITWRGPAAAARRRAIAADPAKYLAPASAGINRKLPPVGQAAGDLDAQPPGDRHLLAEHDQGTAAAGRRRRRQVAGRLRADRVLPGARVVVHGASGDRARPERAAPDRLAVLGPRAVDGGRRHWPRRQASTTSPTRVPAGG